MDQQWFYGRQICIPVYSRFLDLKTLQSWENEWQKSFKADKYFIIPAGTKNTKINYEYKIHKQDLEKVPHSKYLGVTFNDHSSGSSMYKYLTFITCSMIYQYRYSYAYVNENIL
jgi:hypothetical protein